MVIAVVIMIVIVIVIIGGRGKGDASLAQQAFCLLQSILEKALGFLRLSRLPFHSSGRGRETADFSVRLWISFLASVQIPSHLVLRKEVQ